MMTFCLAGLMLSLAKSHIASTLFFYLFFTTHLFFTMRKSFTVVWQFLMCWTASAFLLRETMLIFSIPLFIVIVVYLLISLMTVWYYVPVKSDDFTTKKPPKMMAFMKLKEIISICF